MAVVMKVADDRDVKPAAVESLNDVWDGLGRRIVIHGYTDKLGTGRGKSGNLLDGAGDIGGVGIGHRLHNNGGIRADANLPRTRADGRGYGLPAVYLWHKSSNL